MGSREAAIVWRLVEERTGRGEDSRWDTARTRATCSAEPRALGDASGGLIRAMRECVCISRTLTMVQLGQFSQGVSGGEGDIAFRQAGLCLVTCVYFSARIEWG